MSRMSWIPVAVLLVTLGACASSSQERMRKPPVDRQLITAAELEGAQWPSMFEAISAMRGAWLTKRGPVSFSGGGDIVVYLDRNRLGGPDSLRSIPCDMIASARLLSAPDAQSHFGMDHPYGAIVMVSRKR